jgi:phosphoadenosine phosphosulfate reductase
VVAGLTAVAGGDSVISRRIWETKTAFSCAEYESVKAGIQEYLIDGSDQRLHWCSNCNVPLLTPICYRCNSRGRKFIVDAKPVFSEERGTLEEICGRRLPGNLYTARNRLYYRGRFLMSVTANNGDVTVSKDHTDSLPEDFVHSDDYAFLEPAIAANVPVLRFLELQAMDSIREIVQKYPDRRPVVSFSGGKDSAVVAHLVARAVGGTKNVSLFFADTTLEHPETNDYVKQFAEYYGLQLTIERARSNFFDMCDQLEPPSRIMRWCCTVFKANPLNAYLRERERILGFDGIRRAESNRRRDYERVSGNKKALRQLVFRPILDWSSLAVWLYIFAYEIPYNPAYEKGYARVGCVICPFSTDFNDFLTRKNYPEKVRSWESMLMSYFRKEYADKFSPADAKEWIRHGLWKERKPHHRNQQAAVRVATCPSLNEYAYRLEFPIDAEFLEYLKPFGDLEFITETGFFKVVDAERFCITGMLGDDLLTISFTDSRVRHNMFQLERQVKKAMNCVKCGACVGTCPYHAIEVQPGESFVINDQKCTHCLACVRSNFTHYGCVALSYKGERNWIEET